MSPRKIIQAASIHTVICNAWKKYKKRERDEEEMIATKTQDSKDSLTNAKVKYKLRLEYPVCCCFVKKETTKMKQRKSAQRLMMV